MNKFDVIKRAKKILKTGPLLDENGEHGEYCPFCAISLAKTQLDCESENESIGLVEILKQRRYGTSVIDSDKPLIEARELLIYMVEPFTKQKTLKEFNNILEKEITSIS